MPTKIGPTILKSDRADHYRWSSGRFISRAVGVLFHLPPGRKGGGSRNLISLPNLFLEMYPKAHDPVSGKQPSAVSGETGLGQLTLVDHKCCHPSRLELQEPFIGVLWFESL